jgi:anaerobic selenocysteine-containing dehydrogenase
MDCPDTCSLAVHVRVNEGDQVDWIDQVDLIKAGDANPDTAGFICDKIANFNRRVEHQDRLLHPLRRVGPKGSGAFEQIGWEEALDEVVGRLQSISAEYGGEAILPFHYGGSNGVVTDCLVDALFFSKLGASRLGKTICAAPTTAVATAMYGKMPGVAFEDYPRADCILIWGANPKASNIHLVPYLKAAKRNGAFIASIDPRRNFSKSEVDLHIPVLPGTDLVVALALINYWASTDGLAQSFLANHAKGFEGLVEAARKWTLSRAAEVAGVDVAALEKLATVYAQSSRAILRCGWGLERNRNGGQAVAAVLAIPALLGKFGARGSGYTLSNSGATQFDRAAVIGEIDQSARELNMTQLGAQLLDENLDPPVQALFVYNANPAATVPDQERVLQGLEREDLFTVVVDQVMTDSAMYADVILPAVTFLEGSDLKAGYGSYAVGAVRPVISPRGESRSNAQIFGALGRRMGWSDQAFSRSDEETVAFAAKSLKLGGRSFEDVVDAPKGMKSFDFSGSSPVQFETVSPRTVDGKIDLCPEILGSQPYSYEEVHREQALCLISPAGSKLINSTLGEFNLDRLEVTLHPDDATSREISSGDRVRVFNDLGKVECIARVDAKVRPGVVSMPKGAWRKASLNGLTSTALCPSHVNVVAGGACFNDARVDVELA